MIDSDELYCGYKLSFENAKRMIADATNLKKNGSMAGAYILFHIALEEIGKCQILYFAIYDFYNGVIIDNKYLNAHDFKIHPSKIRASYSSILRLLILMNESGQLDNDLSRFSGKIDEDSLNNDKNSSLYVGVENNKFVSPAESINQQKLDKIEDLALLAYSSIIEILDLDRMEKIAGEWKRLNDDPSAIMEKKYQEAAAFLGITIQNDNEH